MFTGFPDVMPAFFVALSMNNNREFFNENRHVYEETVKKPLLDLAEDLRQAVCRIDPQFDTLPNHVLSRIYRDIRFSPNKLPYRDHMWIGYRRIGENREDGCGFYFEISAFSCGWGCGFYNCKSSYMEKLRKLIVEEPRRVSEVFDEALFERYGFEISGDVYKRKFIPPENVPLSLKNLYRKKWFYIHYTLQNYNEVFSEELVKKVETGFNILAPAYHLMRSLME